MGCEEYVGLLFSLQVSLSFHIFQGASVSKNIFLSSLLGNALEELGRKQQRIDRWKGKTKEKNKIKKSEAKKPPKAKRLDLPEEGTVNWSKLPWVLIHFPSAMS